MRRFSATLWSAASALALHEQARFVREIEIVVDVEADEHDRVADLSRKTRERFAAHMDPRKCEHPIVLTLRPSTCSVETQLRAEAITRTWFGVQARRQAQSTCFGCGATPRLPTMP